MFWPLGRLLVLAARVPNVIWIAPSIFIAIVSIVAIVSTFRAIPSDGRFAKSTAAMGQTMTWQQIRAHFTPPALLETEANQWVAHEAG